MPLFFVNLQKIQYTQMKKIISILFMLSLSLSILAQGRIDKFYGMSFGLSRSQIEDVLTSKGKTVKWKSNSQGKTYAKCYKNISIAGGTFDEASFFYNSSGLYSGNFSFGFDRFSKSQCQSLYNLVLTSLLSKYGNPQITTSTSSTWNLSNGKITLKIVSYNAGDGNGTRTETILSYSNVSVDKSDF